MLRNFRQVFKGNQTPTAAIMLMVALSMLAYLAPSRGLPEAPDSVVARVYGRDILKRDLDAAMENLRQRMGKGANLEMMLPFLRGQAIRQLINQKLSEEVAERHGVLVTDPEVKERMVATLKQSPIFLQADGTLRPTDEIEKVLREHGFSLSQIERDTRMSLVGGKLMRQAASLVPLDEATLDREYHARFDKVAFDYVTQAAQVAQVADPGDPKLDAFLKASDARFQMPPRRVVQVAVVDQAALGDALKVDDGALKAAYEAKKASAIELKARHILFKADGEAAVAAAMKKAQDVQAKLKAGGNFAKLADELTEDPSGKGRGGDLGWFRGGMMVKPFEDAAMALQPGEISGPVRTIHGIHLIQLEERKQKSFEDMKESLRADLTQERFASKAKERLETLRKRSGDHGDIAAAAKALGLKVETSKPFLAEDPLEVPGLPSEGGIPGEAFRMKVGDVSKVQPIGGKFAVFRVTEERPLGIPPLAEIRKKVLAAYQLEEARKQVFDKTATALKGGDLKVLGGVSTQAETTIEALRDLGKHPAIRKALLDTPVGSLTPLLWNPEGALWVAKIAARTPAPALTFEKRHEVVQKIQEEGAQKLLNAELQDLESKGRLRPGLSSLWGRYSGIWMNPRAGSSPVLDEE